MSEISKFHNSAAEAVHRCLFQIHSTIYWQALERVKEALKKLHALESHRDIRDEIRGRIVQVEAIRSQLEAVGEAASKVLSGFVRADGCDASCQVHKSWSRTSE